MSIDSLYFFFFLSFSFLFLWFFFFFNLWCFCGWRDGVLSGVGGFGACSGMVKIDQRIEIEGSCGGSGTE